MTCIVFNLPTGAGGVAAQHRAHKLITLVNAWASQHNVCVKRVHKGYRLCFEFERASDYTLFALSWTADSPWDRFELVESSI